MNSTAKNLTSVQFHLTNVYKVARSDRMRLRTKNTVAFGARCQVCCQVYIVRKETELTHIVVLVI